jgi:hypothetical protein
MEVVIAAPDGTEEALQLPCTLGRGRPDSLRDASTSRKHFLLSAVDGVQDAIRLEVAGGTGAPQSAVDVPRPPPCRSPANKRHQ